MPSINDTGHAKNVANFHELITFCESYGAAYQPNKETLTLDYLHQLHKKAQQELNTVIEKVTAFNNAVTVRQNIFADIKPLITKVVNAFSITDAPEQTIADIKSLNKKVQGTNSRKKTTPTTTSDNTSTPDTKTISTSQQSYDNIIEHHAKLISLLNAEPSYKPNEPELQIKSLTELLKSMQASTKEINTASAEVSNARIARNEILYKDNTGLYDTALNVKKYIKSVFGSTSPQYKQVSGISFSKIK